MVGLTRTCGLLACLLVVGAGCAGSDSDGVSAPDDSAVTEVSTDATSVATAPESAPAEPSAGTAAPAPSDTTPDEPPVTTLPEPAQPAVGPVRFPGLGPATIVVLTPVSGGGIRPDLEWDPVDEAATYEVTLLGPEGGAYWAWSGTDTSVPVGGVPRLGSNSAGPAVTPGMAWYVVAVAADGTLIGQSAVTPIEP